jgi:hypothetical protein
LSNYYNAELTEAWPLEVPGNELSSIPNGLQPFAGVTFDIRGIVQLLGAGLKGQLQNAAVKYPEQVSRIEVNRKCHRLHVLHGALGSAPEGTQIGSLALHYATGYELVLPILFGEHVRDFWQPTSEPQKTEHGVIAWTGTNAASRQAGTSLRLYRTSWENPALDVEIISIDFRSAMDLPAPFLIALTVE